MKNIKLFLLIAIGVIVGYVGTSHARFLQQPYSEPTAFAIPKYLQYLRVDGALFNVPNVVTTTAATSLSSSQSGSIVYINAAAGYTITLPTPAAGLYYDIVNQITQTSGTQKYTSGSASIFMQGAISTASAGTSLTFACNGTTHTDIATNGGTTGGLRGGWLRFTGIDATHWNVYGLLVGSGTAATSCDTTP